MIKKTIITTLFLFISYTLFIAFYAPSWWHASQHQWQENVIKAQHFLYDEKIENKNVIVGSSLSCRLIMDSLPNFYNLSFSGQSTFDGLKILTSKPKLPKKIYIEMNIILRRDNPEFTSYINSPINLYLKNYLPSLRDDRQPIAIMGILPRFLFRKDSSLILNGSKKKTVSRINKVFFGELIASHILDYSQIPDKVNSLMSFNNLQLYVNLFEGKGVNVVFFEVPVNYNLTDLPKAKIVREQFLSFFPETKYNYIMSPDTIKYTTQDGLHLTEEEAKKFTSFFKSKATKYHLCKPT